MMLTKSLQLLTNEIITKAKTQQTQWWDLSRHPTALK